jgi:hypothetical protein
MKKTSYIIGLAALLLAGVFAGCKISSFNASVFQSENIASDTAIGATHSFNAYYASQTNGASLQKLEHLDSQKSTLYSYDVHLGETLKVTDALRTNYVANLSVTNQTAVLSALAAVQSQSTNIFQLVQSFINSTN